MKPIILKHKVFKESLLKRFKNRLIKRAEEKHDLLSYKFLERIKKIYNFLNNVNRPSLILSFFIFMFFMILILNKIQLKTVMVESREVSQVLNEWNGRINAIMFFGFWNWLYLFIAYVCAGNIPNKPQGWAR